MKHIHATTPIQRLTFATRDLDEAHEVLSRVYVGHGLRVQRPADDFSFHQELAACGPMSVGRVAYDLDAEATTEPLDHLLFVLMTRGHTQTRAGRDELRSAPGDVFLNRVDRPLVKTFRQIEVHTLALDRDLVDEVAAAHTGVAVAEVRFTSMTPISPGSGRHFRDTMAYLRRLLTGPAEPLSNPLVIRSAAQLVASAALAGFANSAMAHPYLPGPGRVTPAAVRRAAAFIDEHAGEPITPAEICAVARLGPRALQSGFRRHLDITPMAYLRRARLDSAHRDLGAADPTRGDSVAAIARRWGYVSMSRFASDYRTAFGRPPSRTLRS